MSVHLDRLFDQRLAQASYLIRDDATREAMVVDPARDVTGYLEYARTHDVRITRVAETHIHADFVSGTRELVAATGASTLLSGDGGPDWQYAFAERDGATLLHDGDVIGFGDARITAMHTPGHTPEHLAFLVADAADPDQPLALLSGDFLFVGDVGRPDLLERAAGVSGSSDAAARRLFASLRRLVPFGDFLPIWPGHGAGSACGKALGSAESSTLGEERRHNWALQIDDPDVFVAAVLEGQPTPPPYFARMKRINRDGPALLGKNEPTRLDPAAIAGALRAGVVIDLRSPREFAAAHVPGTLNLPLNKSFTKWAGWLLPAERPIYLIAPSIPVARDGSRALASIGWDRVAGVFDLGVITAAQADRSVRKLRQTPMRDVDALQRQGTLVVDVREGDEWDGGHLDQAVHHPLGTLAAAMASVDRDQPVAVHCAGGTRSAIGAALLEQMGFADVTDLVGGWNAWKGAAR